MITETDVQFILNISKYAVYFEYIISLCDGDSRNFYDLYIPCVIHILHTK